MQEMINEDTALEASDGPSQFLDPVEGTRGQ